MAAKKQKTKNRKNKSHRPGSGRRAAPSRSGAPGGAGAPSAADLGKLLKDLPALACDPEMADFGLGVEAVAETRAAGLAPPDAIGRLADPAFHARLLVHLNNLKNRAFEANDDTLRFLIEAAVYYIEEVRGPPWDNPLVVGFFYRDVARLNGKGFTPADGRAAVKKYERRYKKLLDEKVQAQQRLYAPSSSGA